MRGFWEQYGTLSTVDWCEPNYIWVSFVAEWWNTLTSVPMGLAGLFGFMACWFSKDKIPLRFQVSFLALSAIGFGSVAFHGTLLRVSQATDELPMIGLSLISMYCLAVRKDFSWTPDQARRKRVLWGGGTALYGVAFVLAYFLAESYFLIFLLSYSSMVFYVIGRAWWLTFKGKRSALLERIGWTSFLAFGFGVFGLWIPEHVIFSCDHPIQALPLHAGWHITSTIGGYGWVLWAIGDYKRLQQDEIRLTWSRTGLLVQ